MKKILLASISLFMALTLCNGFEVFANISYEIQSSNESETSWTNIYKDYYLFEYNGEAYYIDNSSFSTPKKYNEKEFNFFVKDIGAYKYIKLDDGYMAAINPASYDEIFVAADSWKGYHGFYVNFYDNEYNLISQYDIGAYIQNIYFYNDKYYCSVYSAAYSGYATNILYESSDKINWTRSNDTIADREKVCDDLVYKSTLESNEISFDSGISFYNIKYENKDLNRVNSVSDIPLIIKYTENDMFISKDNVYFIDISLADLDVVKKPGLNKTAVQRWYFTNTHFVIDSEYYNKIKIPKQELEDALNQISYSPYVLFNDKILSFEVPPVIQDDRTLIPIRFLFEQMGAEVDWNDETKTATVSQNNTTITFAINEADADINGQTVTMDVPAQLINGKTMVPVRFLSENLGYTVEWDDENRIITIE